MTLQHPFLNYLAKMGQSIVGKGRGKMPSGRAASLQSRIQLSVEQLEGRLLPSTVPILTVAKPTPITTISSTAPVLTVTRPFTVTPATTTPSPQQERINWIQSNLLDTNLRNLAVTDYTRDNALTRNDMVGLFTQAASDGLVTISEYQDLQTLVLNGTYLSMPDYVQNLANKVVNGAPGNATYQDDSAGHNPVSVSLGNLQANSPGLQLTRLTNKWFLGDDLPDFTASLPGPANNYVAAYKAATQSSLFGAGNTISYGDVTQGNLSDGYLLSALSDLAQQSPNTIRNMFIDNGDGTFTVRFINGATTDFVTVNRLLPVDQNSNLVFAGVGQPVTGSLKLWAPLLEKAYAQLNHSGWLGGNGTDSYAGLKSGFAGNVFPVLTGLGGNTVNAMDQNSFTQAVQSANFVTLKTGSLPNNGVIDGFKLVSNQEYAVVGAYNGFFTLFNPNGFGLTGNTPPTSGTAWSLQVTWSNLFDMFDSFDDGGNPSASPTGVVGVGTIPIWNTSGTTISPQQAWIQSNLLDANLRSLTVTDYIRDNALTRNDMVGLFNQAAADGLVTRSEFKDLQTLVANGSFLSMPDYVHNLAYKVMNGDPANDTYQYGSLQTIPQPVYLGNLQANSLGSQLTNLVGKWFLGVDHPSMYGGIQTTYPDSYWAANGSLFGANNTISYTDIKQGQLGDCYFLSALADLAQGSPDTIRNMFTDNGDGTFTVRFMNGTTPDYVTVDRYLLADSTGHLIYAGMGQSANDPNASLWVPLLEKAYTQISHSGWTGHFNGDNYALIAGGFAGDVLPQITGLSGFTANALDRSTLTQDVKSGLLVSISTTKFATNTKVIDGFTIVSSHEYSVVGYNAATDAFTLFNPHGVGATDSTGLLQNVTWGNILDIFSSFDVGGNPALTSNTIALGVTRTQVKTAALAPSAAVEPTTFQGHKDGLAASALPPTAFAAFFAADAHTVPGLLQGSPVHDGHGAASVSSLVEGMESNKARPSQDVIAVPNGHTLSLDAVFAQSVQSKPFTAGGLTNWNTAI